LIITKGAMAQLNWKMETEGGCCFGIVTCWGHQAETRLDESVGTATGLMRDSVGRLTGSTEAPSCSLELEPEIKTPSVVSVATGRDVAAPANRLRSTVRATQETPWWTPP